MYRSNRHTVPLMALILIGVVFGIGFFIYDNVLNSTPAYQPPPTWTPIGAAVNPTQALLPPPTASSTVEPDFPTVFIPNLGVLAPVVTLYIENGTWDVNGLGPRVGHLQGTQWVDEPGGNIVLAGHVEMQDGRIGVFSTLEQLQPGDPIVLTENNVEYQYAVTEIKEVAPDDLSVLYPTGKPTVTLITCRDYNFISQSYEVRLIVVAERVNT